jgi:hypothetical protein
LPKKLKNIRVDFLSLVASPATGMEVVLKQSTGGAMKKTIHIKKTDDTRHVAYGLIYAPDKVDSQGEFADRAEIEKAAYGFMKNLNGRNVDVGHSFKPVEGAYVGESWLVRKGDELFPDGEGAWAVGVKVDDVTLWEALKKGEVKGFSMAGTAEAVEVVTEKSDVGLLAKIAETVRKAVEAVTTKDKQEVALKEERENLEAGAVEEIKKGFDGMTKAQQETAKKVEEIGAEMKKTTSALDERLTRVEKARASAGTADGGGEAKKDRSEGIL